MYDYVIVTHLPVFYKVNLYNELSNKLSIHVFFVGNDTFEKRSNDFNVLSKCKFDYTLLNEGSFQSRNIPFSCLRLFKKVKGIKFNRLLVSGWDLPEFWFLIFLFSKKNNCLALESTILDSSISGLKGYIKKLFLKKIGTVFASGNLHNNLLQSLRYEGNVKVTNGVGIINYDEMAEKSLSTTYEKRFLFIGRLVPVKNLKYVVEVFNSLPDYHLTIVGEGEERTVLQRKAHSNIEFVGSVNNTCISGFFYSHDFLILPSLQETWGLVVEEAFYFNLPVLVSERCGSVDLVEHGGNGMVFSPIKADLRNLITSISQKDYYSYKKSAIAYDVKLKNRFQVESYLL